MNAGELNCNAYPGDCEVRQLAGAHATDAQRALADTYCHTCVADTPAMDCVDGALHFVSPGEGIGVAVLVLSDDRARAGQACADAAKQSASASPFACETAFITCLAAHRPIVGSHG